MHTTVHPLVAKFFILLISQLIASLSSSSFDFVHLPLENFHGSLVTFWVLSGQESSMLMLPPLV